MNIKIQSKYVKAGLCIVLSGAALLLLNVIVNNMDSVRNFGRSAFTVISPFVYGLIIAYLLCPVYNYCYKAVCSSLNSLKNTQKTKRIAKIAATTATLIAFLGIVGGLFSLILPETVRSIAGLVQTIPDKAEIMIEWIDELFSDSNNPELAVLLESFVEQSGTTFTEWINNNLLPNLSSYVTKTFSGAWSTLKTLLNIIIGIFVCVYFLNSKEIFQAQAKKTILALCSEERANAVFEFCSYTNMQFSSFIRGKLIDSLIIGIICAVLMSILNMPYVILISTIVGITNVIPFFGPFIGAIPGIFIILLETPVQALYFGIMILLLQQFDGTVLGPKILGKTSGLASFWVLFAILIFGGMFGFVGMIIGVPTFAVIYYYCKIHINKKLVKKNLTSDTAAYQDGSWCCLNPKTEKEQVQ